MNIHRAANPLRGGRSAEAVRVRIVAIPVRDENFKRK